MFPHDESPLQTGKMSFDGSVVGSRWFQAEISMVIENYRVWVGR